MNAHQLNKDSSCLLLQPKDTDRVLRIFRASVIDYSYQKIKLTTHFAVLYTILLQASFVGEAESSGT